MTLNKIILLGVLITTLISCSKSSKNKSSFLYENGESSVELVILNGNDFLIYDVPILADFKWKKIDPKTGSILGTGIKMLGTDNGITKTEITVPSNYLDSDTLNIKLRFEINGEKTGTEFNVPIKSEK